ncbi:Uncharacterized conserved protein YabE, contains G5 and tandem DUF348 domains [Alteribacillus persepolensis]|uniref:Uncharacterized conserved protein YabE, contains G5 and tandem DUF348 domains n=1 Tax=Alteribacillus persepolensis TaxID=568899 RepID=A0A1G8HYQ7_9BACI|nr:G5 and 3D domain-containing protein [Alteribacillus persepolensis]SDI11661.1 Uncharacterized conserved protein YabE, contains G5 and tandem DUF348 domains [Alteribacillus persepolensis]
MRSTWTSFFLGISTGKRLALVFLAIAAMVSFAVFHVSKATVTIEKDGEEFATVATHAETVGELLQEEELTRQQADEIIPSLSAPITGNMTIEWVQAKEITVSQDEEKQTVVTTAKNVEEVLEEQNISASEHDKINKDLHAPVTEEMEIVYESAFPVTIHYDDKEKQLMTTSTTVADLLNEADVRVSDKDRVQPDVKKTVASETDINVVRVEKVTDVVEEEVDYATVTRRDDSLPKGEERVIESGQSGVVEKRYEVTLENGEEVSRTLIDEKEIRESKDEIVAVGAREATVTASRGGDGTESPDGQTLTMQATAYTANCTGCSGVTATGVNLNSNPNKKVVAVDPSVIPLGTRVHVEGYGEAVAADTGGAIKGNKIDLHVPTKQEAGRFGRQTVKVTILE